VLLDGLGTKKQLHLSEQDPYTPQTVMAARIGRGQVVPLITTKAARCTCKWLYSDASPFNLNGKLLEHLDSWA
jgi:hypothetical protein